MIQLKPYHTKSSADLKSLQPLPIHIASHQFLLSFQKLLLVLVLFKHKFKCMQNEKLNVLRIDDLEYEAFDERFFEISSERIDIN